MAVRKIVQIAEEKCNGCGECIPNCAEGALKIIDGKARLVGDRHCDGLGACLGTCPQGAIMITEREADEFDEAAAGARADMPKGRAAHAAQQAGSSCDCPEMALMSFAAADAAPHTARAEQSAGPSALSQWPVQLSLVPVNAPFLKGADVLLAADCVPFALADFHARLLRGRKLLIGCPKLDDCGPYVEKLAQILKQNDIHSLTVAHMEVPCCFGLIALAKRAAAESGKQVPVEEVILSVQGDVREPQAAQAVSPRAAATGR